MSVYEEKYNIIPIVLAADDNYSWPMSVTIVSLLKNADINTFYDIYILVPDDFPDKSKKLMCLFMETYRRCKITFINMKDAFGEAAITIKHITKVTYYRLKIPELLPQYDKCIYIDVDTVVTQDLSIYYGIEMDNYCIAGVKAPIYQNKKEYHCKRLNIENIDNYINAGVVIFNLKRIREKNIDKKFIELAKNVFESQDQDIVNVACFNEVKCLPFKYNVMTKYIEKVEDTIVARQILREYISNEEIKEGLEKPVIIHYADKIKPWYNKNVFYADIWWEYAKSSPFTYINKVVDKDMERQIKFLKKELENMKNSYTYKVGRVITFIPRKLRGGIWCLRDNGIRYTVKHTLEKIVFCLGRKR